MATESAVTAIVWAAQIYLLVGLVAAIALEVRGLRRLDPAVASSSIGFRVLIFPGLVAFWPLLLRRWLGGSVHPPEEHNAHRDASREAR